MASPLVWMGGTPDIRSATAAARDLGATIEVDCVAVGVFGTMTVFIDPTGACCALWQEAATT